MPKHPSGLKERTKQSVTYVNAFQSMLCSHTIGADALQLLVRQLQLAQLERIAEGLHARVAVLLHDLERDIDRKESKGNGKRKLSFTLCTPTAADSRPSARIPGKTTGR